MKNISEKIEKAFLIQDKAEAIKYIRKLLKKFPTNIKLRLKLALLLISSDNQKLSSMAEAEDHLKIVVALSPKNEIALFHLGIAIQTQGKKNSDIFFKKAIKIDSQHIDSHYALAKIYYEKNKLKKSKSHFEKLLKLRPNDKIYKKEYEDLLVIIEANQKSTKKSKANRWPVMCSDFFNLSEAIEKYILPDMQNIPKILTTKSNVVTLGSCFAGNLARVLRKNDVNAENITIGEYINSTYANRVFLEWVSEEVIDENLSTKMSYLFVNESSYYKKLIENAEIIIFTLGVAPAFFDRKTNNFVMPRASQLSMGALKTKYHFRTTTVEENTENLEIIIKILRKLSKNKKIILTLSPVPLSVTFEKQSAVIADCLSKSVLRSSIENVIRDKEDFIYYWPSFEIVRWIGSYKGDAYGQEDGTSHHVSEEYIDEIIGSFIKTFGDDSFYAEGYTR